MCPSRRSLCRRRRTVQGRDATAGEVRSCYMRRNARHHRKGRSMTTPVECVILDIPEGLRLDLLGLVVEIGRVRILADRAGLLGAILAALTCGGASAADNLEAMAQMLRASDGAASASGPQQASAPQGAAAG